MRNLFLAIASLALLLLVRDARAEVVVVEVLHNSGTEERFQQAKKSSIAANKAFEEGDTETALNAAEAAYRAYPNASTALVMATIYDAAKRSKDAFRWFLIARNSRPTEGQQARLDEALRRNGKASGYGVLQVVADGGTLTVDGVTVPVGAWAGIDAGKHTYELRRSGFVTTRGEVAVPIGHIVELPLVLAPRESPSRVGPLGLIIGGVVLAGAGAGVHVWGLGADSELQERNGRWGLKGPADAAARAEYQQLADDAQAGTTTAFVLYGVAAASIVAGSLWWALGDDPSDGDEAVSVAPSFGSSSVGMTMWGAF